ncbi:cytidine deaminase [Sansalvadorimonas verongulae]|uniref:cytidine deaminase n=1 Tax=Sansalvadorimonas verongulae TaxID=2172824 RepID=UPI0012BD2087|nr:cytidine deaminase [Sansalvadorimonas verongulae]MTI12391.1 cytidine deaminase [Sansalvadorimonas verongulae]
MPLFSFDGSVLGGFAPGARSLVETMLFSQAGMLTARQAEELASCLSISTDNLPEKLLPVAAACAVVPVSNFHVGVVMRGGSGALYLGANMEFEQSVLGMSLHGEQSATNNVWLHGETSVTSLVVNAAPCGHCRQFLHELKCSDTLQVKIVSADGQYYDNTLSQYLPEAFGPGDLGVEGGILASKSVSLGCEADDELAQLALDAANKSYAPYTGGYAGVVLEASDGTTAVGRYAENAAYNPSLPPFTSAMSRLRFMTLGRDVELKSITLVGKDTSITHATHIAALKHLYPDTEIRIFQAV